MRRLLCRGSTSSDHKSSGQYWLVGARVLLEMWFLPASLRSCELSLVHGRRDNWLGKRDFDDGGRKFAQSTLGRTALRQSFHGKTPDPDATPDGNDGRSGATLRPNSRCRSALASLPFRTAASRDANREIVLVLALLADDSSCAPA